MMSALLGLVSTPASCLLVFGIVWFAVFYVLDPIGCRLLGLDRNHNPIR